MAERYVKVPMPPPELVSDLKFWVDEWRARALLFNAGAAHRDASAGWREMKGYSAPGLRATAEEYRSEAARLSWLADAIGTILAAQGEEGE